uniref:Tetrahydrofolate dehydrogenase/cyclohydrolase NAD(P)-binding domain-containing protein n=2 Tax=Phaeomonas parva TaxID=124430 RepID=A0A7S1TU12_9STRA|mmetsp:Transcript_14690/g.44149  ORF Transcript_14690/g.44149 Transcript_14690/m.44149 type:complete len:203 (+) Transcript_14690:110-718(+)
MYRNVRVTRDGAKHILPCTPLAVVKTVDRLGLYDRDLPVGDQLRGVTATVVNRSEVVGRPLAALLANDGAEVYSVDIDSIYVMRRGIMAEAAHSVEEAVRRSDIVVLGVPSPNYKMNPEWIKDGAVVVNVASHKNVDEAALDPSVKYVPLVGKVTVAMLERNVLRLHDAQLDKRRREKALEAAKYVGAAAAVLLVGFLALRR